jgi:uncharacterized membrane protein SpoIIM required for sporulation
VKSRAEEREHLRQLEAIVQIAGRVGVSRLSDDQLLELPRLYRYGSTVYARMTRGAASDAQAKQLSGLLMRAHALQYARHRASKSAWWKRVLAFYRFEVPRTMRAEWKLLALSFSLLYGLALISGVMVTGDLSLAYSLFSPQAVTGEIEQLRAAAESGESFRGNFNFGLGESAGTAGFLIGNNIKVALMFFVFALVPPLYLFVLLTNSLMLGTYTAVAGHWDQAGSISSILWCHGVLEIQAIIIAGTAGLVLLRPFIAPGVWSRKHAIRRGAVNAWRMWAAVIPMLLAAGVIEAFITPHVGLALRLSVAILTGVGLLAWLLFSGREAHEGALLGARASAKPS